MSYDLDFQEEKPCPCGNSSVVIEYFSNEWGQTRETINIQCEQCRATYEVSYSGQHKNGKYESYPVLVTRVPEPEPRSPVINIYTTPLQEQYCISYSYETLTKISEALSIATTYAALSDDDARKAVRMCKASCNTQRISIVREVVATALGMYKTYNGSFDNIKKLKAEYEAKWPRKIFIL